jgi:hypothetical protein
MTRIIEKLKSLLSTTGTLRKNEVYDKIVGRVIDIVSL